MLSAPTPQSASLHLPELLAPAGTWECAKAAVENGADAIYFGLDRFNARMRAQNFTEADLPELMAFLHGRGVKGYVTVNTLIFPDELAEAEQYLRSMIAAGVDAAIVQDVGICRLIRHLSPDFPIHGSTQMTVTSAAGAAFAKELGCNLVVLARECSIKDIRKIQSQIADAGIELPLEVFVHGALCVAYSGQCLTSESLGGRSANRGECAQACRMPYDMIVDGRPFDLGDRRYLLSPQDLAGLPLLSDLARSGIVSLKIEGRLKTPEYVANVTRVYRQALNSLILSDSPLSTPHSPSSPQPLTPNPSSQYDLEMAFSRGLYTGWLGGINNQELVHARFGKKRGVYLGDVTTIQGDRIFLNLQAPLKAGDGVVFDSGHPAAKEEGGRVYTVDRQGQQTILTFGRNALDLRKIHVGDRLWKTSDPELDKALRQTYAGDTPKYQRPIFIEVHGDVGHPLVAIARDEQGHIAQAESETALVEAHNQPLTSDRLSEQLGRLGGTPFKLGSLQNHLSGSVMLPLRELNQVRRNLVAQLEAQRIQPKRWQLNAFATVREMLPNVQPVKVATPNLIVLTRNLAQLQAALEEGIQTLYCEFEDPRKYRDAVGLVKQYGDRPQPPTLFVAPSRITKPGENWILQQVRNAGADGYLIRNYDQLHYFAGDRCVGDFSLNVANPLTADYFLNTFGLERLTTSYDLNIQQLESLLRTAPPHWFEVTIHQHMPMFHMEHCVFCAFLSEGTDYTNCGRPCEQHEVKLRDRTGTEHILQADAGCRNTLFNGVAQTGAEYVRRLIDLGVQQFRIEFVHESPNEVSRTIQRYRQLLSGNLTGTQLWRELKLYSQLGVTRGSLEKG
ncbi:DUF3656 domain-containing U32 family peptidase [Leptolyngbya sp. AN02str]|uniref:U32 family peptidase n=1 Tax=Leptolyngbya sp. AN02str TaxID=3423363 RepID=UPI003D31C8F6